MEKKENIIVYSGTFDPLTKGHMDLINRALKIFDKIIIAIATGFGKTPMFQEIERQEMIKEVYKNNDRVKVKVFSGLLVDFVKDIGATSILRGLRMVSDFEYEFQMASMNRKLQPEIETFFLTPLEAYSFLSSTMVRQVSDLDPKRVQDLVDNIVYKKICERHKRLN